MSQKTDVLEDVCKLKQLQNEVSSLKELTREIAKELIQLRQAVQEFAAIKSFPASQHDH